MTTFSKMVIMSSDEADRLRDKKITQYNPTIRSLAHLDAEMESILGQQNIGVEEKLLRYQNTLMRFGQLTSTRSTTSEPIRQNTAGRSANGPSVAQRGVPNLNPIPGPSISDAPPLGPDSSLNDSMRSAHSNVEEDTLLEDLSDKEEPNDDIDLSNKDSFDKITAHLARFPDRIGTDARGRVVIDGTSIKGSNYSDLVTSLSHSRGNPNLTLIGQPQFIKVLKEVGLNPNFVTNKSTNRVLSAQKSAAGIHKGKGKSKGRNCGVMCVKGVRGKLPGIKTKVLRLYL